MSANRQTTIRLTGLNADNLLAFMAALGVFRSAFGIWGASCVRMAWEVSGSSYSPVLSLPEIDVANFLPTLHANLKTRAGHAALTVDKDLKIPLARFSEVSKQAASCFLDGSDTWGVKMMAAFGCGICGNEDGNIEDTAFRTMSGAGDRARSKQAGHRSTSIFPCSPTVGNHRGHHRFFKRPTTQRRIIHLARLVGIFGCRLGEFPFITFSTATTPQHFGRFGSTWDLRGLPLPTNYTRQVSQFHSSQVPLAS